MDTKELKVGDRVRILTERFGFSVGEEAVVTEVDEFGAYYADGPRVGYSNLENLAKIHNTIPVDPTAKATNPKDAIGSTKLPLDLVPDTLEVFAALAFTEGATKYGSSNWRVAGVRASIYYAAMKRHMKKWWNGENADPATRVPHLASVIACAAIILDAEVAGKLTDDRPPAIDLSPLIDSLEGTVKHLKDLHKDKHPVHHFETDKA